MILCLRSPVVGVVCRLNHKNRTMNIKKLLEEINEQGGERPDCYDFAVDFLGEPEGSKIDAYVKALEKRIIIYHILLGEAVDVGIANATHRLQEAISNHKKGT